MNLIQQAEQLKMLPDSQVAQMMERPTSVPPWLAVAEMQRRETMRKAYQAHVGENQESVVQQMAQQQQMAPQTQRMQHGGKTKVGGGIEKVPLQIVSNPEPESDELAYVGGGAEGVPVSIPAPEVGIAALANDPPWKRLSKEELQAEYGKASSLDEWHARYKKAQGTTRYEALLQEAQARETKHRNKKSSIGDILMAAGISMAASKSPNMLGAIAEGGIGALNMYGSERNRNQGLADMALRDRLNIAKDQQQSDDYIMRDAMQSQIAEERGIASMMQAGEANRRAEWRTDIQNNQAQRVAAAAVTRQAAQIAAQNAREDKKAAEARLAAAALAAAQIAREDKKEAAALAIANIKAGKEVSAEGRVALAAWERSAATSVDDAEKRLQSVIAEIEKVKFDPKALALLAPKLALAQSRYEAASTDHQHAASFLKQSTLKYFGVPTVSPDVEKKVAAKLGGGGGKGGAGTGAAFQPRLDLDWSGGGRNQLTLVNRADLFGGGIGKLPPKAGAGTPTVTGTGDKGDAGTGAGTGGKGDAGDETRSGRKWLELTWPEAGKGDAGDETRSGLRRGAPPPVTSEQEKASAQARARLLVGVGGGGQQGIGTYSKLEDIRNAITFNNKRIDDLEKGPKKNTWSSTGYEDRAKEIDKLRQQNQYGIGILKSRGY